MAEKCLIAASFAALVFHPSFSFKPKCNSDYPSCSKSKKKQVVVVPRLSLTKNSKEAKPGLLLHAPPPSVVRTSNSIHSDQVSLLLEDKWPIDIVATTFRSGWSLRGRVVVEKVLKVNHSLHVINNFEEYREGVKSKCAKNCPSKKAHYKLMDDGNELQRFHGALIACSLGKNGVSSMCQNKRCAVCRVVTCTFPVEDASIQFYENSWKAHENIMKGSIEDRACARTAIIICRVIAGRIANHHELEFLDEEEGGFDSVASPSGHQKNGSEELVALNPRAVLPCFVVIYRAS